MSPASDPALVRRFAEALERLNPTGGRIGLAVSGGPDSMAMLLLAHQAIPGGFDVATVNHGLRPEAAEECALVERVCQDLGVDCAVLNVEVGKGNVQQQARLARYGALGKWAEARNLIAIATAHHADDQAETLLMRLNRGSGVTGLAGVRETGVSPLGGARLIRPLLGFRKTELAHTVSASGITPARDPSNDNLQFDRVRIRRALQESEFIDALAMARSAAHLADAEEALQAFADRLWQEGATATDEEVRLTPPGPRAMALKLVALAIAHLGGEARGSDVARLVDRLDAGESGNLAGVLATVERGEWYFRREPPRKTG